MTWSTAFLPAQWSAPELKVSRWGTVKAHVSTMMTSMDGVFAAGDIVRGASLVVWAIRDGMDAAHAIDTYLAVKAKPLIAAVEGAALAGGTEICLACDTIVASTTASFGIPEVKRSLVAAGGAMFRLGRKIPMNIAMEFALTGDPMDATRLAQFGLINTTSHQFGMDISS